MKAKLGLAALRGFERPVVLAIGVFDGVHLGHQKVIRCCVEEARRLMGVSAVLTFHPHPAKVVRPDSAPPLLTSEEQDRELFDRLGVELCVTIDFDAKIQQMHATEFLQLLLKSCPTLRAVVVGHDWHFGRQRDGNFSVLKKFCDDHGLTAIQVEPVIDPATQEIISSTLIRKWIAEGKLADAERLLGRPYALRARVVGGEGRGRGIGFPTANLETDNELIPAVGVYAVRVRSEAKEWRGAMNIGFRPTVDAQPKARPVLEVHLLDFSGDLSGKELEVEFLRRLRDEKKFSGPEELKAQIAKDVEAVRRSD
jgi:riboflavin kinase / FMN adenylyltransferase